MALGFSGGRWPSVHLSNGTEVKPASLYLDVLLPLIAGSEHVTLLQSLAKTDKRPEVAAAVQARLAQLAAPPPPPAVEDPPDAPPDADPPKVEDSPAPPDTGKADAVGTEETGTTVGPTGKAK